ncbi:hypothetical protein GQ600_22038 [Phytophthora cactorum]|nr:hypothetical protein GQ600_22038 [Phytophthora cactorum]
MASQQQGRRRAIWLQLLALICLSCSVVMSQTVGEHFSLSNASWYHVGPPSTTTPATTPVTAVSATTFPPSTTAPAASTETPTTITNTPTASTVLSSSGSASETSTPTSTTKAPATTTSPTATKTTAPTTTPSATADPDTSSAATTAAPVVNQYNSSTLPPSVSSSVLNGSDLVNVEVTETTLGNGSTSFDYIIVTSSGETEKVIVLSPETMDPTSSNYSEAASDQSGSSRSDRYTSNSSGSLGLGTIIGIIVGVLVFLLALGLQTHRLVVVVLTQEHSLPSCHFEKRSLETTQIDLVLFRDPNHISEVSRASFPKRQKNRPASWYSGSREWNHDIYSSGLGLSSHD